MWIFDLPGKVTCFIVALVLLTPVVSGADQKECMETATTQPELNQCAASQLKAANDELNRVYQAILSKYKDDQKLAMIIVWAKTGVAWMEWSLRSVIQVLLAERMIMAQKFPDKLRNAQRAWLTFRDAELEAKFPFEDKQYHYGSVYPMCANLFLARRTQERIKHLREWLDGTEEGDTCAGSVQYKSAR